LKKKPYSRKKMVESFFLEEPVEEMENNFLRLFGIFE
jgi:hypothetical protein